MEEIEQSTDDKLISPHMPQYITKAPWYLNKEKPTLSHQRAQDSIKVPLDKWYSRGVKQAKKITKFRKGACENCGAMSHTAKFCVDRPRKKTAKNANRTFGHDEEVQEIKLNFEAKIDRWNGFDPEMYNKEVIQEWNAQEEERKKLIAQQLLEEKLKEPVEVPKNDMDEMLSDSDLDNVDEAEEADINEQDPELRKNPRIKTLNKNLRSRQETVKYLHNVWDNTAHYDGKSRAMRTNPNDVEVDEKDQIYKGDNIKIYSGNYLDLMDQENFTKDAKEKGEVDLNNVSMPSQAELAFKHFKQKKTTMMSEKQKELYEKYGGKEHSEIPDEVKKKALEEQYELIEKAKKAVKRDLKGKTKYEEDVHRNGHTQVWGSFWHKDFGWGYK